MVQTRSEFIYSPAQTEAVDDYVKKRIKDGLISDTNLDDRLAELALSINSNDITTRIPTIGPLSRISKSEFNDIIERLYIDILASFKSVGRIESIVGFKQGKANREYQAAFDSFLKVKSDAKSFVSAYKSPEFDGIRKVTFFDARNYSLSDKAAVIDDRTKTLILSGNNTNIAAKTTLEATVTIDAPINNMLGKTEHIVDPDPSTFWQAVVLSDVALNSVDATIVVKLGSAQNISSVDVLPFSPQPLVISNMEYSIDGITYKVIPNFIASLATQNTDYVGIKFAAITARFIRVTLKQCNGVYRSKIIPKQYEELTKDLLLDRIFDSLGEIGVEASEADSEVQFTKIVSAIYGAATLIEDPKNITSGYEYVFGVSDLILTYSEYESSGEYLGPRFLNKDDVFQVELDVDEKLTDKSTIEYDIEVGESRRAPILPRSANNIVDKEVLVLDGKSFGSALRFPVDVTKKAIVFENNEALPQDAYAFTANSVNIHTNKPGFRPSLAKQYTASYSPQGDASKLLIGDTFNSIPINDPEQFTRTDSVGKIILKNVPYVEYGIVNDVINFYNNNGVYKYAGEVGTILAFDIRNPEESIRVALNEIGGLKKVIYYDGIAYGLTDNASPDYQPVTVTVDRVQAINVTDHLGGDHKILSKNPINNTIFEYIQDGNNIIFGTTITGKDIVVTYNIISEYVRPIATLKHTSSDDITVTPIVKDMTLFTKSRKFNG